ncbi:DUF2911 domain-containing protein [Mesoflavibacter zeaxanthinifaciens]|uniref:DUF2911 domain-containing protein n=1 Tax=Mesoflavibacter zeaxanthinifaciens TaxID=393060 RepID=UPI003A91D240
MNKFLKWIIYALIAVTVLVLGYQFFTKTGVFEQRLSPPKTVAFKVDDLNLEVFYNRPSKRDREVFGALVPFNQVWRTGANEATTFETNQDLTVQGMYLPKGKYTIWTVPMENTWKVMFNSKQYEWGVNEKMEPMWDPNFDVIEAEVPVKDLDKPVEQFTIAFDNSTDDLKMTMAWDDVKIEIPLNR